ncbi:MAG: outer membrane protein transport protein [Bacteroidota bacterium]|nr:outer membrane protein transport protein [Bacteroidota bacterium]
MRKITLLLSLFLMISYGVNAGGYQVGLQGQRQTGMGLIGTGFIVGPSTVFFNPGGMSFLDSKYSFSVGVSPIMSNVSFQYREPSAYEAQTDNPISFPFSLYMTGKVNDKLSLGLGIYTPYGSTTIWGDNWRGKYVIQDISLKAIYFQPTVSYKISDKFSAGVGFVITYGDVSLNKAIPLQNSNGQAGQSTIEGSGISYGFNAGLVFRPTDKLELGLTYRSEIMMSVEGGDATFDVPSSLSDLFPAKNKFDADLPLPASVNFGASYSVTEKFTLGVDVNYVFWSTYQTLDFDFETNTSALEDMSLEKNYSDGAIYRIGGEYLVNDMWTVRAGFYYDSPVVDDDYYAPETPDAVKLGFTGGLSFAPNDNFSIDVSYLYLTGLEREVNYTPEDFGGKYKYNAFIPGIGISYKF